MSPTPDRNQTAQVRLVPAALAWFVFAAAGWAITASPAAGQDGSVFSDWAQGHNVKTRVVAGGALPPPAGKLVAGVEMDMAAGWKTYWRNPGDAGGIPPGFDWSRSTNVASIAVLYPAPVRMKDAAGTTIGYKGNVIFPVLVEPSDKTKPVDLKLDFTFGTCREICVPGEAVHEVALIPGAATAVPAVVDAALLRVPVAADAAALPAGAPLLERAEVALDGKSPRVVLHVRFAAGGAGADVFAEGPAGEYVPLPQLAREGDAGLRIYEIDLTDGADVTALKGQTLKLTLVSNAASREVDLPLK